MHSHLSHALLALRDKQDTTLSAMAVRVGMSQGALSRLIADGRRPDIDTLCALCTKQSAAGDGLGLLLAHLRDEIDRSGRHQTEVTIAADKREPNSDIRLLESQAQTDSDLRAILRDLAQMVRAMHRKMSAQTYPEPIPLESAAAEDAGPIPSSRTAEQEENLRIAQELKAEERRGARAPLAPKPVEAKKSAATKPAQS